MLSDRVDVCVHGPVQAVTLVYLPGVHGDSMLLGHFRRALGERVRLVEITYPRTLSWSLGDYARGVEAALAEQDISSGWLLGESFGSQVLWELLAHGEFHATGAILAGGFARHPAPWMANLAARICGKRSFNVLRLFTWAYLKTSRVRFRHSPETLASVEQFVERRTIEDCQAWRHRLMLVARNDPRAMVQAIRVPLYALSGWLDPIVPWFAVKRWFQRNCPTLCEHRVIWLADHNVLGTAPDAAAAQVLQWLATKPEINRSATAKP